MVSKTTLQRYINSLDEVIVSGDVSKAEELQDEIIAVFEPELGSMRSKLTNYQPFVIGTFGGKTVDSSSPVDFIKDARTLRSRLQMELEKVEYDTGKQVMRESIFISHRSTDADIADMIKDFLVATGIPNEKVFCSSLPGNDINFRISAEVKKRLQESTVNILILSKDYYKSAYCLNEAGIAWYLEDEVDNIAVCLPEINEKKMWGFFNGENKVRRLDNENDVAAIYDAIRKRLNVSSADYSVVTREKQKLAQRYELYIKARGQSEATIDVDSVEHIRSNSDPFDYAPIQVHASVMLFFAAEDRGEIIVSTTLSGTSYCAGKVCLNDTNEPRELAKWESAIDQLLNGGYIKRTGKKDPVFQVTEKGYNISDAFKNDNQIDANMSPQQILELFDE